MSPDIDGLVEAPKRSKSAMDRRADEVLNGPQYEWGSSPAGGRNMGASHAPLRDANPSGGDARIGQPPTLRTPEAPAGPDPKKRKQSDRMVDYMADVEAKAASRDAAKRRKLEGEKAVQAGKGGKAAQSVKRAKAEGPRAGGLEGKKCQGGKRVEEVEDDEGSDGEESVSQ